MAEPADLNLDELKRRARRRLIGAIVLALVRRRLVPMLLESEPQPLGEDVSVQIPPVDEGKFVSKIAEGRTKQDAAKPAPATAGACAGRARPGSVRGAAPRRRSTALAAPDTAPAAGDAAGAGRGAAKSLARRGEGVLAPARRRHVRAADVERQRREDRRHGEGRGAPPRRRRPRRRRPRRPRRRPIRPTPAARGGFAVQLAAFSDDKGANALPNKLKRAGYPGYTEPIETSRGTLWRVRVGPYPSREAAAQSRDKLKAEGHTGIVVAGEITLAGRFRDRVRRLRDRRGRARRSLFAFVRGVIALADRHGRVGRRVRRGARVHAGAGRDAPVGSAMRRLSAT